MAWKPDRDGYKLGLIFGCPLAVLAIVTGVAAARETDFTDGQRLVVAGAMLIALLGYAFLTYKAVRGLRRTSGGGN